MAVTVSDLGSERAEQVAERLRQFKPTETVTEEVREAIRAAVTMAYHTLYAWDAVQQLIGAGTEGGRARDVVGKAFLAIAMWLEIVRSAVRVAGQADESVALPYSLEELRHLEDRLLKVYSAAEQLLAFVDSPPPQAAGQDLERLEAVGSDPYESQYLSGQDFLARVRARRGA